MALNPVEDWKTAKDEFFKLTGEKKPREAMLKFFSTTHTGLSSNIKELGEFSALPNNKRTASAYLKLKNSYAASASGYCTLLENLIKVEATKTGVQGSVKDDKVVMEKVKTDMYRGLKMLKSKLDNYKSAYEVLYKNFVENEQKQKSGAADVPSDQTNQARIDSVEKNFEVRLQNGFNRFKAASQAVKATPTVDVWNREFGQNEAVRSLTTALAAYKTIKTELEKGNFAMSAERLKLYNETRHWITELTPWGDGAKRALGQGDNVLAELQTVSTKVKACGAVFGM